MYIAGCSKLADRITCHWSAGDYNTVYGNYHLSITGDGRIFTPVDSFDVKLSHSWKDNTGNIGICLCAGHLAYLNGTSNYSLGECPPTDVQLDTMAQCIATIMKGTGISLDNVYTHAERALKFGYGPYQGDPDTRWDLWFLKEGDEHGTGGQKIRQMVEQYVERE